MEEVKMLGFALSNRQATTALTFTTIGTVAFLADLLFDINPIKNALKSFNIGKSSTTPVTGASITL